MAQFALRPIDDGVELLNHLFAPEVLDALPYPNFSIMVRTNLGFKETHETTREGLKAKQPIAALLKALAENSALAIEEIRINTPQGPNNKQYEFSLIYKVETSIASISFGYWQPNCSTRTYCETQPKEHPDLTPLLKALSQEFSFIKPAEQYAAILDEGPREAIKAYEAAAATMIEAATKNQRFIDDLARDNTEHVQKLTRTLQAAAIKERRATQKDFEEQRKALEKSHEEKEQALSIERKKLDDAKKEFDLRSNTGVRRKLLDLIKGTIESHKELSISGEAAKKRRWVTVACILVMIISLGLFGVVIASIYFPTLISQKELPSTLPSYLIVMASSLLVLFASTLIFYIRWCSDWFHTHARWEKDNRQFEEDILRASWIAELIFEWQKANTEKNSGDLEIPKLFDAFAANLFIRQDSKTSCAKHPFEDIIELGSRFRRVKVNKTGVEIEQNPASDEK